MADSLSPSKILLLALTTLYCQGYVPANDTLDILSFISSHLLPTSQALQQSLGTSAKDKDALPKVVTLLKGRGCTRGDQSLLQEFLMIVQRIASLDSLFDFFGSLQKLFRITAPESDPGQITLTRTSLLGSFVRRAYLEFEKLSFQNAIYLWQAFQGVRGSISFVDVLGNEGYQEAAMVDELFVADKCSGGKISRILGRQPSHVDSGPDDLERLIIFQVGQMQSMFSVGEMNVDLFEE